MPVYRSAQGRQIDMTALAAKNEKTRAVGNMNVNARGDIIDSDNKIVKDNTKRVKGNYSKTITQNIHKPPQKTATQKPVQTNTTEELNQIEKELFDEFDNEEEIKK
jgi:hypothetical protein